MRNDKASKIYDYIRDCIQIHGFSPTVREICDHVGIRSTSTVHAYLKELEEEGLILKDPMKKRTIKLPGSTDEELTDALIARLREMNKALDIPTCIRYYEGGIIDEAEFMEKLPKVAELAVGDACTGSNPRTTTPDVMAKLLKCCYYDEEVDF